MVSGYDKTPPDRSQQPHRLGLPLLGIGLFLVFAALVVGLWIG
jgi:hypothetical protein